MTCLFLRRIKGGWYCEEYNGFISTYACRNCPHYVKPAGHHDLALHPHAVHVKQREADAAELIAIGQRAERDVPKFEEW